MTADGQWCLAWSQEKHGDNATRAAIDLTSIWKIKTINVGFLEADADSGLKSRIQDAANEWCGPKMARVRFVFVKDITKAHIRISFLHKGSWSVLGQTALDVPKNQPTMNYGWLKPGSSDSAVRQVVLHEFGHALGLIHEHQNPGGGIPWNKPQVYRDLAGPPNSWDQAKVDRNLFAVYDKDLTNHTEVDPKSIMMYPIAKSWVTDPKFAVDLNEDLSDVDRAFIKKQYK